MRHWRRRATAVRFLAGVSLYPVARASALAFGLELEPDVEVRVFDSTADMSYLVIPQRSAGTEQMREDELTQLVTGDSMIGVTRARQPDVPVSAPA